MNQNRFPNYFLFLVLAVSLVLVYFIIKPFLGPLILAAVFAFFFQPVYRRFLRLLRKSEGLAAFFTIVLTVVLVLLPITLLGIQIFKDASSLYQTVTNGAEVGFAGAFESVADRAREIFPIPENLKFNFNQYARQGLEILVQNFGAVFSSLAKLVLNVFVFLVALYFFLKDGKYLKDYFVALSPLADKDDDLIVSRLEAAVTATIKGGLAIGLIQGVLTGIGLAIFGVPNAALWGGVAAITALIPGVGTALVLIPAIVYLFITGNTFGGFALSVWGLTAVGLVDNFLGPKLIGRGMHLHPLAVFLAVLGGLAFFGPLGFLLGPLAVSLCLALINIYFSIKAREIKT